jgi:hypothetical protein
MTTAAQGVPEATVVPVREVRTLADTPEARLVTIESLLSKGLITEAEYNRKRDDILQSL